MKEPIKTVVVTRAKGGTGPSLVNGFRAAGYRNYYPQVTDLREELAGQTSLVSCRKIKRMLGWRPRWNWRDIRAESEAAPGDAQPPGPTSS